jgi:hypothetical protein
MSKPNDSADNCGSSRCSHAIPTANGIIVESGIVNGISYVVWRGRSTGKTFVYINSGKTRRNMGWLKKRKKDPAVTWS